MKLTDADRKKLPVLLEQLGSAVEDLLLSGLTTASDATRQILQISFQEASRMRLLRLGSTLRVANDELGRFTRNEADFSRRRLNFFLRRAWLLGRGVTRALQEKDEAALDRLLWNPASVPIERLDVVVLGIGKKVAAGSFVAFEFRMRALNNADPIQAGQRLVWSSIFPVKPGNEIPPEGFLHVPQKQKFKASILLERQIISIQNGAVTVDESGGGRITLLDHSTVSLGDEFDDWKKLLRWDAAAAVQRIRSHEPGPLDLEIEMQEEIVLDNWEIGESVERSEEQQVVYPLRAHGVVFDAVVTKGIEGKALQERLEKYRKQESRPLLYGLMHYAKCRLVVQPLATFDGQGPEYLTISNESIDKAALLKALKFT